MHAMRTRNLGSKSLCRVVPLVPVHMGTHARSVQGDIAKVERLDQYSMGVVYWLFFPARVGGCRGILAQKVSLLTKSKAPRAALQLSIQFIDILDWTALRRHPTRSEPLTILPNGISMFVLPLSGRRNRASRLFGTAAFREFFFCVAIWANATVGTLCLASSIVGLSSRTSWHEMRSRVPRLHPMSAPS